MTTATLDPAATLKARRDELLTYIRDVAAKADDEGRDFNDDEFADVQAKMAELRDVAGKLSKADAGRRLRDEIAAMADPEEAKTVNGLALAGASVGGIPRQRKSSGELFTGSDVYGGFLKAFPAGVSDRQRVQLDPVHVPGGMKALITGGSSTSAGALILGDEKPMQPLLYPPLTLRDVITVGHTDSDSVEYAQVATRTNAAAMVPEATTAAGATAPGTAGALVLPAGAGLKPESAMTFTRVTSPVRTVAHWLPITKRALSDASQIRTYIDEFLRDGLDRTLEAEMLTGDGTGEHFTGVMSASGTQAQAWSTDIPTTIRKAITKVQVVGGQVTGVLISPADNEALDLLKDTTGRYFGNGPFGSGPSTVWGYPRVVCYGLAAGNAIVGDLRTMVLWDREQASISVSDSHADFFVRNLLAILAEFRAAFGVLQPSTLTIADLTA